MGTESSSQPLTMFQPLIIVFLHLPYLASFVVLQFHLFIFLQTQNFILKHEEESIYTICIYPTFFIIHSHGASPSEQVSKPLRDK